MNRFGSVIVLLGVVSAAVSIEAEFSCSFDRGLCGFSQQSDDKFDWTRKRGQTPSQGTGPDADHTSRRGYYMYIEASGRRNRDNAVLEKTVSLKAGENWCLTFFYHMSGSQTGTLNVYVGSTKIFSKTGKQGPKWNNARVHLPSPSGTSKLTVEGIVGRGFQGDIGIDDIHIGYCDDQGTSTLPPIPSAATPPPVSPPGSCGIRPSARIIGGTSADHGDWPWQAQLKSSSGSSPFCGGSLIHPQWVLTATHCVNGATAASTIIRLGAHRRSVQVGTEQDFKVSKVITHPSYHNPLRSSHDIALLKLEKPAQLNKYVNLVCLPDSVPLPTDGTQCWITGWGRTHGPSADYLRQAAVPIVSENRCRFAYMGRIHESMICAGLDRGGIDACQGDSGGPMVCDNGGRFYIQGATSWGIGCGRPGKFGVYAKVKYELDWIHSEMSKH